MTTSNPVTLTRRKAGQTLALATSAVAVLGLCGPIAHAAATPPLDNRSIAYVLTNDHWAVYTTANGKEECPQGLNASAGEQYPKLFPADGEKRHLADTWLAFESAIWFPSRDVPKNDVLILKESVSKVAKGLNLDGKVDPDDHTSPDGEKGIDNQFSRAVGCVEGFRPGNTNYDIRNLFMQKHVWGRMVIELTDVDSLLDDDDVKLTVYKGRDELLTDSGGAAFLPYGIQRVDTTPGGRKFMAESRGRIKNGVLTTDPADVRFSFYYAGFNQHSIYVIHGGQFRLNVLPESAAGLLGGYLDIENYYRTYITALNTQNTNYGKESWRSIYPTLYKLADGYPDPKDGHNTAISAAKELTFKQVYIERPARETAAKDAPAASLARAPAEEH